MAFRKKCLDCGKSFTKDRKRSNLYEGTVIFSLSCVECYLENFPDTFNPESSTVDKTRVWNINPSN